MSDILVKKVDLIGLIFFNTWFTDFFFFQKIYIGGGKKIKIKLVKNIFLFNLKQIWIVGKEITQIV